MKHEILIYNKTEREIPEKFIKNTILKAFKLLKPKQPVELAVLVVDKEEIKRLNKIWRKTNEISDELSFGLNSRQMAEFAKGRKSVLNLGEIVVNSEKISDKNYLSKILIHSILHLIGCNHEKSLKEAKRMEKLEEKILKNFKI